MWTFRSFNRLGLTLLLSVMVPQLAAGAQAEEYKQHVDLAVQLYQRQYFEAALQEFQKAYSITPAPRLLFNMGQALMKLGRTKDALTYFEHYKTRESTLSSEEQRLLARTMADAQVQLEAERVLAEQAEKDQQEKRAQERAAAEKERKEHENLKAELTTLRAAQRAQNQELLLARAQRAPLSDPARRRRVVSMLVLSGAGIGLSAAGTVMLALDGFPSCDRESPQQLCPTHLQSKLPGGVVLGIGLSSLITSQIVLGLSLRPTRAEQ